MRAACQDGLRAVVADIDDQVAGLKAVVVRVHPDPKVVADATGPYVVDGPVSQIRSRGAREQGWHTVLDAEEPAAVALRAPQDTVVIRREGRVGALGGRSGCAADRRDHAAFAARSIPQDSTALADRQRDLVPRPEERIVVPRVLPTHDHSDRVVVGVSEAVGELEVRLGQ